MHICGSSQWDFNFYFNGEKVDIENEKVDIRALKVDVENIRDK